MTSFDKKKLKLRNRLLKHRQMEDIHTFAHVGGGDTALANKGYSKANDKLTSILYKIIASPEAALLYTVKTKKGMMFKFGKASGTSPVTGDEDGTIIGFCAEGPMYKDGVGMFEELDYDSLQDVAEQIDTVFNGKEAIEGQDE